MACRGQWATGACACAVKGYKCLIDSGTVLQNYVLTPRFVKHVPTCRRGLPEWQVVPGTRIVVDCFGRAAEKVSGCRAWILTHFHSDHYRGLTARFSAGAPPCCCKTRFEKRFNYGFSEG